MHARYAALLALVCALGLLITRPALRQVVQRNRQNLGWLPAVMTTPWQIDAFWETETAASPISLPNPTLANAYTQARLQLAGGDEAAAAASLQHYLNTEPESDLAHNLLGTLQWRAGDVEQARLHFQQTGTAPTYLLRIADQYLARSEIASVAGEGAQALALAQQAQQIAWLALDQLTARPLSPADDYAHYWIGYQMSRYWRTPQELTQALTYLNQARHMRPDYYPYQQAAGRAAYSLGDYTLARSILLESVALQSTPGDYIYLGQSAAAQNDYAAAAAYFEEAVALGATQPNVLNALGDAYQKLDQLEAAAQAYTAALTLDPHNAHARTQLDALASSGK